MIPIIPMLAADIIRIMGEKEVFYLDIGFGEGIYGEEEVPMTATEVRARHAEATAEFMQKRVDEEIVKYLAKSDSQPT